MEPPSVHDVGCVGHCNRDDATASRIWVVCVAVTGSSDSNTVLANVTGVTPRQPQEVQLPGAQAGSYTVLTTCLSGLDLSYDTTDHMFQGATGGCGINPQASGEGLLNATANIWDSSGNQAVTASIDAGVLATVDNPSPFMVQQVNAYNGANVPALTFPSAVERAVAMIQSFNVQYASGDHGVAVITVGCPNLSSSGSTVNLGAVATTTDDDGNDSNDGLSYVNLLVVAVPQSSSTAGRP